MDIRIQNSSSKDVYRILFVCSGNTCRSPMAQVIAERMAGELSMGRFVFSSAGTSTGDGMPASHGAQGAARRHGLTLDDHSSTPLSEALVAQADLILTMGPSHLSRVEEMGGAGKGRLLGEYAGSGLKDGLDASVPDPFGGGDDVYEATFRTLEDYVKRAMHRLTGEEEVGG